MVTEKLDGTLIIVWRDWDGELHANTRGMLEWHGVEVGKRSVYLYRSETMENPFVKAFFNAVKRLNLMEELEGLVGDGETVMFELEGKVPASQAALSKELNMNPDDTSWTPFALAKRNNESFALSYISDVGFPVPSRLNVTDLEDLMIHVSAWKEREGVVLYYPGLYYHTNMPWWNYMVKLKSSHYALLTTILPAGEVRWREVARVVMLGQYDDLVSLVKDEDIVGFSRKVFENYCLLRDTWEEIMQLLTEMPLTEKERNYVAHCLNLKWLLPYLDEGKKRGESALKKLVIEGLPKDRDGILHRMERLGKRLHEFLAFMRSRAGRKLA